MANDDHDGGRKFFRIPVDETSKVSITIGGTSYEVVNVAAGGVGVALDNGAAFATGDNVTDIALTIDTTSAQATGCIAHISPEGNNFLCGIALLDTDGSIKELLQRFIDNHKSSLFSF